VRYRLLFLALAIQFAFTPNSIGQRAGIYKDLKFDSLQPVWTYVSYDNSIVDYQIDSPRDRDAEFDGYSHIVTVDNIIRKPLIHDGYLYLIQKTIYDGDVSGGLIEKINIKTGKLIWQSTFDLRSLENREFIEGVYIEEGNLVLMCYEIVTPDPDIPFPVLYNSNTIARGVLKIRKYNLQTGTLEYVSTPDYHNENIKLITPGPDNDVQCYSIGNGNYELIQFYFWDQNIRLYVDTLSENGVLLNTTDTLQSQIEGVDWTTAYRKSTSAFFRSTDGKIYWLDYYINGDGFNEYDQAYINITYRDRLVDRIDLDDKLNENLRGFNLNKYQSVEDDNTYWLSDINKDRSYRNSYLIENHFDIIFDFSDVECGSGSYCSFYSDIENNYIVRYENENEVSYLRFYEYLDGTETLISEFRITDPNYICIPLSLHKMTNGDYLFIVSNREIVDNRVRGKFKTTYLISENTIKNKFPSVNSDNDASFAIYPNPVVSGTYAELYFNDVVSGVIEVFDMSGRRISRLSLRNRKLFRLDLDDMAHGMYLIKVSVNGVNHTKKIVVI